MTETRESAASALAVMAEAERRSAHLFGYAAASPFLLILGAAWLAAGLVIQLAPDARLWIWPAVSLAMAPAMIAVAARQSAVRDRGLNEAERKAQPRLDAIFWRLIGLWALAAAFLLATLYIFAPISSASLHAFIGMANGLAIATAGLWLGVRLLVTGLVFAALVLATHAIGGDDRALFMGLIGGAGLIVAGLWLRKS